MARWSKTGPKDSSVANLASASAAEANTTDVNTAGINTNFYTAKKKRLTVALLESQNAH